MRAERAAYGCWGPHRRVLPESTDRYRYQPDPALRETPSRCAQLIAWQLQRFRKNKAYSTVHVSADCNPYDV